MTADGRWVLTARSRRDFRRLDAPVQRRVAEALDRLVADPPQGDITKLTGTDDEYRLRVGGWRVRFIRQDGIVYVLRVLPRLPRLRAYDTAALAGAGGWPACASPRPPTCTAICRRYPSATCS